MAIDVECPCNIWLDNHQTCFARPGESEKATGRGKSKDKVAEEVVGNNSIEEKIVFRLYLGIDMHRSQLIDDRVRHLGLKKKG